MHVLRKLFLPNYSIKSRLKIFSKDIANIIKYGRKAPLFAERIWICPKKCRLVMTGWRREDSAYVVNNQWPPSNSIAISNIDNLNVFKFCYAHWVNGIPWEKVGAYDYMFYLIKRQVYSDECFNIDDITRRYKNLDHIFNTVRREKRIRVRNEVSESAFREEGGIYVHVGPNAELFFGGGGQHRFAIAKILNLSLSQPKLDAFMIVPSRSYLDIAVLLISSIT